MDNDNLLIEEKDLELAKAASKFIEDSNLRERTAANVLATELAARYFADYKADIKSSLCRIPFVSSRLEIADIYLNNNYIDVRVYFDDDSIYVPKIHFDLNIAPLAYMFIKLNKDLSGSSVSGFIASESVPTQSDYNGYYKVEEDNLVSFYDIEPMLAAVEEEPLSDDFKEEIFDVVDGKSEPNGNFYKNLIMSKEAREVLLKASMADVVFNFISKNSPKDEYVEENVSANDLSEYDPDSSLDMDLDDSAMMLDNFDTLQPIDSIDNIDLDNDTETTDFDILESVESVNDLTLDENIDISDFDADSSIDLSNDLVDEPFDSIDESAEDVVIDEPETGEDNISDVETIELTLSDSDDFSNDSELQFADDEISTEVQNETYSNTENELSFDDNDDSSEDSTIDELAEFEYATETTPSLDVIESTTITEEDLDNLPSEDVIDSVPQDEENTATVADSVSNEAGDGYEQIDTLFDEPVEYSGEDNVSVPVKKNKPSLVVLLGSVVLVAALGYFGYTKFAQNNMTANVNNNNITNNAPAAPDPEPQPADMPNETVDNTVTEEKSEEGIGVSIPAIEKNLDASILVSNLNVNWEVPADYTNNSVAKGYLVKIGKIIQLRLKTELLLLTKPPISNRIALELEYNKDSHKFEIKDVAASSGEQSVDDVIRETTQGVLNMNLNTNMSVFDNIKGNPVLVIKL